MILAINPNPAIDHVLFIDSLNKRGMIRSGRALDCIGGKGADSALVLARLGAPHCLVSFIAGRYGQMLEDLYKAYQINYELIWVAGETRVVTVIIEQTKNRMTQISKQGFSISESDCVHLWNSLKQKVGKNDWVLAAGSLPAGASGGFYRNVCEIAHQQGSKVMLDCSGEALKNSLCAQPDIIKLNHAEYCQTLEPKSQTLSGLWNSANLILNRYDIGAIVITLGEDGILLVRKDGSWLGRGPVLKPVNPAGAGDAASAALLYRLSKHDSWQDALRWSCAVSAASVLTEATADCTQEDIDFCLSKVVVEIYQPQDAN